MNPALSPETRAIVDAHWAAKLGCAESQLRLATPVLLPHGPGLSGYGGVYVLLVADAPLVSAPEWALDDLGVRVPDWTMERILVPCFAEEELGHLRPLRTIGPALLAYADRGSFRPCVDAPVPARKLTRDDAPLIRSLRASCSVEEWEHGACDTVGCVQVGVVLGDGQLAALAAVEPLPDGLAQIYIIAHPEHRGAGIGRAAVSRATEFALAQGLIPQYQTLDANTPSTALAARLGYIRWGTSVAVRLSTAP